jgi:hypothetical protein
MLNDCYKYANAINAKREPFPTEPLLMSLALSQHKMMEWLAAQVSDHLIAKIGRICFQTLQYPCIVIDQPAL